MIATNNTHTVDSLSLPELQPYKTLRRPAEHIRQGIFVAEGEKVVRRLLGSGLTIVSLLLTPEWHERLMGTGAVSGKESFKIYIAKKQLVESIVGYNLHQGIMAVAQVPEQRSLDNLLASLKKSHLLVALDGLVNSENVGIVVRNCAAFGVDAVVVGETSSSPYLRRAVRNSMGTVFRLAVVHVSDLAQELLTLRHRHSTRIIATHPHNRATIHNTDFRGNVCIVFGNEGEGISNHILDVCTEKIAIPMMNETDSINVASASSVFLYEASRQRRDQAS